MPTNPSKEVAAQHEDHSAAVDEFLKFIQDGNITAANANLLLEKIQRTCSYEECLECLKRTCVLCGQEGKLDDHTLGKVLLDVVLPNLFICTANVKHRSEPVSQAKRCVVIDLLGATADTPLSAKVFHPLLIQIQTEAGSETDKSDHHASRYFRPIFFAVVQNGQLHPLDCLSHSAATYLDFKDTADTLVEIDLAAAVQTPEGFEHLTRCFQDLLDRQSRGKLDNMVNKTKFLDQLHRSFLVALLDTFLVKIHEYNPDVPLAPETRQKILLSTLSCWQSEETSKSMSSETFLKMFKVLEKLGCIDSVFAGNDPAFSQQIFQGFASIKYLSPKAELYVTEKLLESRIANKPRKENTRCLFSFLNACSQSKRRGQEEDNWLLENVREALNGQYSNYNPRDQLKRHKKALSRNSDLSNLFAMYRETMDKIMARRQDVAIPTHSTALGKR